MIPQKVQSWQSALKSFFLNSRTAYSPIAALNACTPAAACQLVNLPTSSEMPPRLRLVLFALLARHKKLLSTEAHGTATLRSFAAAIRAAEHCAPALTRNYLVSFDDAAAAEGENAVERSSHNKRRPKYRYGETVTSLMSIPAAEWLPREVWNPPAVASLVAGARQILQPPSVALSLANSSGGNDSKLSCAIQLSAPGWSCFSLVAEVWSLAMYSRVDSALVPALIEKGRAIVEESQKENKWNAAAISNNNTSSSPAVSAAEIAPALAAAAQLYAALYSSRQQLLFSSQSFLSTSCDPVAFQILDVVSSPIFSEAFASCALAYCELSTAFAASLRLRGGRSGGVAGHLWRAVRILTNQEQQQPLLLSSSSPLTSLSSPASCTTLSSSSSSSSSSGRNHHAVLQLHAASHATSSSPASVLSLPIRAAGEWCAAGATTNQSSPDLCLRVFTQCVAQAADSRSKWALRRQKHFEARLELDMNELEEAEKSMMQKRQKAPEDGVDNDDAAETARMLEQEEEEENDDDGHRNRRGKGGGSDGEKVRQKDREQQRQQLLQQKELEKKKKRLELHLRHAVRRDAEMARKIKDEASAEIVRSGKFVWKAVRGAATTSASSAIQAALLEIFEKNDRAAEGTALLLPSVQSSALSSPPAVSPMSQDSISNGVWNRRRGLSSSNSGNDWRIQSRKYIAVFSKSSLNFILAPPLSERPASSVLYLRWLMMELALPSEDTSSSKNRTGANNIAHESAVLPLSFEVNSPAMNTTANSSGANDQRRYRRKNFADGSGGWCRMLDPAVVFPHSWQRSRYPLVLEVCLVNPQQQHQQQHYQSANANDSDAKSATEASATEASATPEHGGGSSEDSRKLVEQVVGCRPVFCVLTEERRIRTNSGAISDRNAAAAEAEQVFVPDALSRLVEDITD